LRPKRPFLAAVGNAFYRGWLAAVKNLPAILAFEAAMATVVGVYYLWPAGSAVLSRYAQWQASGGALGTGFVYAVAGGVLSELSLVCFQQRGRWTKANAESLAFKFAIFFVSGCIVYYFYHLQAIWWGTGTTLSVIVTKVIVDQFGYTVIWSTPYYALLTRWHALRYSGAALGRELNRRFLTERMLPILATNWMFWIPAVSFVYAMPSVLQPPLAAFATGIWGLLVATVGSQDPSSSVAHDSVAAASPQMLADPAD
jgi:hypothetical protein